MISPAKTAADEVNPRVTPIVKVFQQCSPAVVNISTTSIVTTRSPFGFDSPFDSIFDFPFAREPRRYKTTSVGSGFVIHRDGYVVTNAHVVARTAERKVSFANGAELDADVVAMDTAHDLAVLKVKPAKPLPFLRLGRSDDLMPGETVIAIGNPLGFRHTITTGIISALDRELNFSGNVVYKGLIQTDAPINPGNSGGPLMNVLGELIGVNTAIRGDAQNIGFAIPVDRLRELLPEMLDVERLRRVTLGAHFGAEPGSNGPAGVRVTRVDAGSPAAKAGLQAGDRVLSIDGQSTPDYIEAFGILEDAPAGKLMKFEVSRKDQKPTRVDIALAELPKPDGDKLLWERFGIRARALTESELGQLRLRTPIGLFIEATRPGSQARREGVAEGDILSKLGGYPVTTLEAAGFLLEQIKTGETVNFDILRIGDETILHAAVALKAR